MELRSTRLMTRYKELEALAYESLQDRCFNDGELQDRIRTFAILRDIDEQQEQEAKEKQLALDRSERA